MNENLKQYPAIAVHPGSIIMEEIEARGISQKVFASSLDMPYTMLNEILHSKRPVSCEMALLVEATLGISAEMLIEMQSIYNLQTAREDDSFKKRLSVVKSQWAFAIANAQ
ncbi:MAG: HigA family addiction module antidote protein [Bacteroidales bacterium]|nr:HigA family addiction module antidote protein [Bacteroidales bacterium]